MPLRERAKKALRLFLIFLKIGAFTFGGGYAMIPLIEYETAEKRRLIEKEEITDIVAIAESTPGPIAVNSATFVGYRTAGFLGAFAATAGVVLPSFLMILLIGFFLRRVMEYRVVQYAFFGIRAGVLALIVKAVVSFWKRAEHNGFSWCMMVAAFLWSAILGWSAIVHNGFSWCMMVAAFLWSAILGWSAIALIALCGLTGFVYCLVQRKRGMMP